MSAQVRTFLAVLPGMRVRGRGHALRLVERGQDVVRAEIKQWQDVSASTDFPDGASLG